MLAQISQGLVNAAIHHAAARLLPAAGTGCPMTAWLRRLWRGELPLVRAFWDYAVLYGGALNLLVGVGHLAVLTQDPPGWLAVGMVFLPWPYNFLVFVAVWRSADAYAGPRLWANLAQVAMVPWLIATCAL